MTITKKIDAGKTCFVVLESLNGMAFVVGVYLNERDADECLTGLHGSSSSSYFWYEESPLHERGDTR